MIPELEAALYIVVFVLRDFVLSRYPGQIAASIIVVSFLHLVAYRARKTNK